MRYLIDSFTLATKANTALPLPQTSHQLLGTQRYIAEECSVGNTADPFPATPLPDFVIDPLGVIPKKRLAKW